MKVSVLGCGYVGLTTGIGFCELGNDVVLIDIDEWKVNAIASGMPPIFERGLEELMHKNSGRYLATCDYGAVLDTDITLVCVGTPPREDGSMDTTYIESACTQLARVLRHKASHTVVIKSTVLPGTTEGVIKPIIERESGRSVPDDIGLAMNPEFLREGSALEDFFHPDRIVIGVQDERTRSVLEEFYAPLECPKLITDIRTAEMVKYASNAFLATKISFANELGNVCKRLGIDTSRVFEGVGLDHRINPAFFRAGIGFGGSCFPKDVWALVRLAEQLGESPALLRSVLEVNDKQPLRLIELLKRHIPDLKERRVGVLGLAFKPDTDDIRESRAIPVVRALIEDGAHVVAYDPMAEQKFSVLFPEVDYASSAEDALMADAVLILTEWEEFEHISYRGRLVIDGRGIRKAQREAAVYEGVCW